MSALGGRGVLLRCIILYAAGRAGVMGGMGGSHGGRARRDQTRYAIGTYYS